MDKTTDFIHKELVSLDNQMSALLKKVLSIHITDADGFKDISTQYNALLLKHHTLCTELSYDM